MSYNSINNDYRSHSPTSNFDWRNVYTKAEAYAKNDQRLYKLICDILDKREFQSNPEEYLAAWFRRSLSETIYSDDDAYSFF